MGQQWELQTADSRPQDLPVPDRHSIMGVVGTLRWPLTLSLLHACGCILPGRSEVDLSYCYWHVVMWPAYLAAGALATTQDAEKQGCNQKFILGVFFTHPFSPIFFLFPSLTSPFPLFSPP